MTANKPWKYWKEESEEEIVLCGENEMKSFLASAEADLVHTQQQILVERKQAAQDKLQTLIAGITNESEKQEYIQTWNTLDANLEREMQDDFLNMTHRIMEHVSNDLYRAMMERKSNQSLEEEMRKDEAHIHQCQTQLLHMEEKLERVRDTNLKMMRVEDPTELWTSSLLLSKFLEIQDRFARNRICGICNDKPRNVVLQACGHCILCKDCVAKVSFCPICRGSVEQWLEVLFC